ncbi:MAG TPA: signal peptide peptidase SppA [Geomonas sp.]|nr:signal peptide peptidase SppA [Geomonas sp.]
MRWWIAAVAVLLNGCTMFNVSLLHPASPLKEKVLEGEGSAKIVLLDVSGLISEKRFGINLSGKPSHLSEIKEALQKAAEDRDVVGVLVRINSPGGTVTASDIIRHELVSFKKQKQVPVHAAIIGMGTSGGYYVATAADRISATPTSVTGSIGVIYMHFQVDRLLEKIGASEWNIKSGDKKDMLSPFRPATAEEKAIMQGVIDTLYRRFIDMVLTRPGNTLSREELLRLADGRIYTAEQALVARLIDGVCYLDESLAELKKAAKVERARVVTYYRPGSYRGSIYAGEAGASGEGGGILSLGENGLELFSDLGFAYLWKP